MVLLCALLVGAAAAWFFLSGRRIVTDDRTIRVVDSQAQLRRILWTPPGLLAVASTPEEESGAALSPDGSELFFARGSFGHAARIFISYRRNNTWTTPQPLAAVNSDDDQRDPRLTVDGRWLIFASNRSGSFGGYDLWASRRTADGWDRPVNLGPRINTAYDEISPAPSPDGRLYFASNRVTPAREKRDAARGGSAQKLSDFDLFVAEPAESEPATTQPSSPSLPSQGAGTGAGAGEDFVVVFGPASRPAGDGKGTRIQPATAPADGAGMLAFASPVELKNVNTTANEKACILSPGGDFLYFASDRAGGMGKLDLYRCRIYEDRCGAPENLGREINTPDDESDPFLVANGFQIYFSSDRAEGSGGSDLYASDSREVVVRRESPPLPNIGRSGWVLIAALILLLPVSMLFRNWEKAQRTLLQRCLIVSLLAHILLTIGLTGVTVSRGIISYVKTEMTRQVSVNLNVSREAEVRTQIRRQASNLPLPSLAPTQLPPIETPPVTLQPPPIMNVQTPLTTPQLPAVAMEAPVVRPLVPQAAESLSLAPAPGAAMPILQPPPPAAMPRVQQTESNQVAAVLAPQVQRTVTAAPTAGPQQGPALAPEAARPGSTSLARGDVSLVAPPVIAEPQLVAARPELILPPPLPGGMEIPAAASIAAQAADPRLPTAQAGGIESPQMALGPPTTGPSPIALPVPGMIAQAGSTATQAQTAPLPPPLAMPSAMELRQGAGGVGTDPLLLPPPTLALNPSQGPLADPRISTAQPAMPEMPLAALAPPPVQGPIVAPGIAPGSAVIPGLIDPAAPWRPSGAAGESGSATGVAAATSGVTPPTIERAAQPGIEVPSPLAPLAGSLIPHEMPVVETLDQRSVEKRQELLRSLGGTKESEEAVARALGYLARNQEPDGRWTVVLDGTPRGQSEYDIALTGLATLCFMASDHTPAKSKQYGPAVGKALEWLMAQQKGNGDWMGGSKKGMYNQAIATVALAEAATMTGEMRYRDAAKWGVRFINAAQDRGTGGWRYLPREGGDTSVVGWQIMALHSCQNLGMGIDPEVRDAASRFLDRMGHGRTGVLVGYQFLRAPSRAMTAEAMLSRMLLGQRLTDAAIREAADYLTEELPPKGPQDVYTWYYTSLSLMQVQGDAWKKWNLPMRDHLVSVQRRDGNLEGSWDVQGEYDQVGGRIYTTALATLTLEVYYRYLPMYSAAPR